MVDYRTKYGFISNYNETIFLKIDTDSQNKARVYISKCIHHKDKVNLARGVQSTDEVDWSSDSRQPGWVPPPQNESKDEGDKSIDHDGESDDQPEKSTISVRLALLFLTLKCSSSNTLDWCLSDELYAALKPLISRKRVPEQSLSTPDGTSQAGSRSGHDPNRTPPVYRAPRATRHHNRSIYVPTDDEIALPDDMTQLDLGLGVDHAKSVSQDLSNLSSVEEEELAAQTDKLRLNGRTEPGKKVTFADSDSLS